MKEPTYNGVPFSQTPDRGLQRVVGCAPEIMAVAGPCESPEVSRAIAAKILQERSQ